MNDSIKVEDPRAGEQSSTTTVARWLSRQRLQWLSQVSEHAREGDGSDSGSARLVFTSAGTTYWVPAVISSNPLGEFDLEAEAGLMVDSAIRALAAIENAIELDQQPDRDAFTFAAIEAANRDRIAWWRRNSGNEKVASHEEFGDWMATKELNRRSASALRSVTPDMLNAVNAKLAEGSKLTPTAACNRVSEEHGGSPTGRAIYNAYKKHRSGEE